MNSTNYGNSKRKLWKLWKRKVTKIKISETLSQEEQRRNRTNVKHRILIIEKNTKRRHQRKIEWDNFCIENNNNNNKRNWRFSKKHQTGKGREKRKRVKLYRKERVRKQAITECINNSTKISPIEGSILYINSKWCQLVKC